MLHSTGIPVLASFRRPKVPAINGLQVRHLANICSCWPARSWSVHSLLVVNEVALIISNAALACVQPHYAWQLGTIAVLALAFALLFAFAFALILAFGVDFDLHIKFRLQARGRSNGRHGLLFPLLWLQRIEIL